MLLRQRAAFVTLSLFALPLFGALDHPPSRTVEATGPSGAAVGFSVTVVGGNDGSDGRPADTVTCTPPSVSLFPIGTTTVSCTGSEGSTASFPVIVIDSTAPRLFLPRDFRVVTTSTSGENVTYTVSATDVVDGSVSVDCSPPSGSFFAMGTTVVSCSASDTRGNTSTGSFEVTVANEDAPPGPNPDDITAEATVPEGARVTFNTGDGDDGDGRPGSGCSPTSGSLFPLGQTTVNCPSRSFVVTVVDTTGPVLSLPSTMTVVSPGATSVTYSATALDAVDGDVAVTCTPPSGSTFPLGTTTVSCSASDSRSNSSSGTFDVHVVTDAPVNPGDQVAEATGPSGAVVTFNDTGLTCAPASGSTFPLGETTVHCSSSISFTVTVVDTTPPVLSLPGDLTLHATSPAGAVGHFTATAQDLVSGSVAVACEPSSGSTFPLGITNVTCSAADAFNNEAGDGFVITVIDADPPVFVALSVSPSTIWPPNKKLVTVTVTANVADNVDATPVVQIFSITCNETIAPADAVITGPLTAKLRADRKGNGNGRIYTLHIEAIDDAGNRAVSSVNVTVPHDQGNAVELPAEPPARRRAVGRP